VGAASTTNTTCSFQITGIQNIKLFGSLINCDLRFICNLVLGTWNFIIGDLIDFNFEKVEWMGA